MPECGLTANVSFNVATIVTVTGSGSPGDGCEWVGMEIMVEMLSESTGQWEAKPGYEGADQSEDLEFDGTGYSKVRARVICTDRNGAQVHTADTGWQQENI